MLEYVSKIKAIVQLLKSDEFFLMTAKSDRSFVDYNNCSIKYEYTSNTVRDMFWRFLKDFIKNNIDNDAYKRIEERDE